MRKVFFLILLSYSAVLQCQSQPVPAVELTQLYKVLSENHIQPPILNDQFGARVLTLLFDEVDEERVLFTQAEVDLLTKASLQLDDDLRSGATTFYTQFIKLYTQALSRRESILQMSMSKPIDVRNVRVASPDTMWVRDAAELTIRCRRVLEEEIVRDMASARVDRTEEGESEFIASQEPRSRNKLVNSNLLAIRRVMGYPGGSERYALHVLLKSIGAAFDPHTAYFSPVEMQNLMAALSTEGYVFGFSLRENGSGRFEISNLLPGGPAWKSGALHAGDVVRRMRWEKGEWLELVDATQEEIEAKFAEFNDAVMEFDIRKPEGGEGIVSLRKEKVNMEESLVRGFILNGSKKVGYISLPGFYSSWGDDEGAKSANDVAAEILKLKKQNIEGLILDLRYNGGGSLLEAVHMAGIFLDAGPVAVQKIKGNDALTLKDMNRGTVYDGPLVILVNGTSASSSEILAAALQDYGRAIIVGSRTFGKATAQNILPLHPVNRALPGEDGSLTGWGFVKVTTGRMYRITGKSIQQLGVEPDVVLPDLSDIFAEREEDAPYSLKRDSIIKKTYWAPVGSYPLDSLREHSRRRTEQNLMFEEIGKLAAHTEEVPGQFPSLWAMAAVNMDRYEQRIRSFIMTIENHKPPYEVDLYEFGKQRLEVDQYAGSVNNAWIESLSRDVSLTETYMIMCDYLETLKNRL